jgi:hypothetical protein
LEFRERKKLPKPETPSVPDHFQEAIDQISAATATVRKVRSKQVTIASFRLLSNAFNGLGHVINKVKNDAGIFDHPSNDNAVIPEPVNCRPEEEDKEAAG